MAIDRRRLLAELPLPLPHGAGELEAIAIAIAVEDAFAVTLPEETLTVAHLGTREAIERVLDAEPLATSNPHQRNVAERGVDEHGSRS